VAEFLACATSRACRRSWIEQQTREHAAPTAKPRLAALLHLFDWLVTGQVMPANPAGSVRGPSHVVKAGKTPVLAPEEARQKRCVPGSSPIRTRPPIWSWNVDCPA
jgi:site-specific recombinase XerC